MAAKLMAVIIGKICMRLFSRQARALLVIAVYALSTSVLFAATPPDVQFQVSPEWLNDHRADEHVRILDLREKDDYRMGHIEGAVSLPVEHLFSNDKGKQYIASLDRIRTAFSGAGIDGGMLVVVYDAGELLKSTRAFWVFEVYGHSRVVVLDGGFKSWMEKRLSISTKNVVPQPRAFVPKVTRDRLATKLTTRLSIAQPNAVIIDARDPDQYAGEKSLAVRSGHIPSAINIPGMQIIDQSTGSANLKSIDELKAVYKSIDPSKTVVTYCNDGVRASATYFALRRLGYNVANYDGAWLEWGNDPVLPISVADAPPAASTR
jgi:thiosulfate/3-mercaptopyruvate sulfurtransferase